MRYLKKPALLLILLCGYVMISYSRNFGYQNPILPGMNPDPSICRVGDDYYLVTSSFVQYPGLPVYHSKDLIHWDIIGYCCREENGFDVSRGSGLYAPTIRFNEKDSTFYVICTNVRNGGNFITCTRNPRGTWSRLNCSTNKSFELEIPQAKHRVLDLTKGKYEVKEKKMVISPRTTRVFFCE